MTTYTIYASSPTGYIQSIDNTSEADAANGLGDDTFAEAVDGGTILVSVFNVGSPYEANEGFLTFDTSGVSGAVTDADLSLYVETVLVDTAGTLQVRLHDFGASITTADWVNRAGLPGKTLLGEWDYTGSETGYQTFTDIAFAANINQSGSTRVLLHDESLLTTLASGSNVLQFADQTASGTTQDPKLVIDASAGGYTLSADGGSYGITGTAASLEFGRRVAAGAGSFALIGQPATLRFARKIAAGVGSFALTGSAATLRKSIPLVAGAGSYAVSGNAAALRHGYLVGAGVGSFTLTGTAASLELARLLSAASGAYSLTGSTATFARTYRAITEAGSYTVNGSTAALRVGRRVVAQSGAYALAGAESGLRIARLLSAANGNFAVTGSEATLTYSAAVPADPTSENGMMLTMHRWMGR